jgi:two-component sensor histidine kinase
MQFLMRLVRWGSEKSPLVRWALTFVLVGLAILSRYALGRMYGAIPAVTFYPMILLVTALFGWKEGVVALGVSVLSGALFFQRSAMYLMPVGWSLVGGLSITIIYALKTVAEQLAAANERQTVLFQEMQHRVANTLQSLMSTLELAARRVDTAPDEAKRLLGQTAERVAASAEVHRRLHDPALFQGGLKSVLHDAVATIINDDVNVVFDIAPLGLSFDQMSILTMFVIEVANNAQKHVFRSGRGTKFLISLHELPGRAVLSLCDDGPAWSQERSSESLGLTILQRLATQLGGTLSVTWNNGTQVSVAFATAK